MRAAITSVCALELLILLRREPNKIWQPDELVRELRSSKFAVAQALDRLRKSNLVEAVEESGYRYQRGSAPLDAICARLESEYARKPITIIRAIIEPSEDKLRMFADAFRLSGMSK